MGLILRLRVTLNIARTISHLCTSIRGDRTVTAATREFHVLSDRTIRPSPHADRRHDMIPLNPWELTLLSIHYIQLGILLPKPPHAHLNQQPIISRLLSSFSQAITRFFPLAGRLATVNHDTSLSVYIDCCEEGAQFIHASAPGITTSDVTAMPYSSTGPITTTTTTTLFPLNGATCHDGQTYPLLSAQVTELADGAIFIACSLNHAVGDGTTFWRFLNCWSEISRTGATRQQPPAFDRWFPDSIQPPIRLPFSSLQDLMIKKPVVNPMLQVQVIRECFFHFSAQTVARLKAQANEEAETGKQMIIISSLQALMAHLWRCVTRARGLDPESKTFYCVGIDNRPRVKPPLPKAYMGSSGTHARAIASAGDVMYRSLGWSASLLNRALASHDDEAIRRAFESWAHSPYFVNPADRSIMPNGIAAISSPRFDVYGNDFGWGKPVAVRSGGAFKWDGMVLLHQGKEEGDIDAEVCLEARVLEALLEDQEFKQALA